MTVNSLKKNFNNVELFTQQYDLKVIVNNANYIEFVLITKCVDRVAYVVRYAKILDSFVQVVGVFETVSEAMFYWLNKLKLDK